MFIGRSSRAPAGRARRAVLAVAVLAAPGLFTPGLAAHAETLGDALALAYQSNPTLQAQRASLRALDESYVQARAGWRPTAQVEVDTQFSQVQQANFLGQTSDTQGNSGTGTLTVNQPIWTGGRTATAVDAATADILAGREQLRSAEQGLFQQVIQSYADVRRDRRILEIRAAEIVVLQGQLDDAQARLKAGEVTRTDVLQSDAQLSQARANLSLSQGQLQISRAAYAAVVGRNPGDLAEPPALPGLPTTVDAAFTQGESDSPTLRQAEFTEQGSRFRIAQARAADTPSVSLRATYGYTGALVPFSGKTYDREATVTASVIQPLFTGGVNASNIRRAVELDNRDRITIEETRRTVVQQISQAWNQVLATRAGALSDARSIVVSREYFADTQEEYRAGQRSTLDILIAEQTLRASEIALAQAVHDRYVAEAALLVGMGRLTAADLVPAVPRYSPEQAFKKVRNAGALPWEGAVAGLDRLASPHAGRVRPISEPPPPDGPVSTAEDPVDLPADARPSRASPTEPLPGTAAPGLGRPAGERP